MGSLKGKFIYQLLLSSLYTLTPLIIFPYISRTLGPENIGKVNFIDYTAQLILLFTSFGIPLYGVREVSRLKNKKEQLKALVSELVIIHLFLSFLGILIFLAIVSFNKAVYGEQSLIVLALVNILISSFSFDWFVQGYEDFKFLSKRTLIAKVLSALAIFSLVRSQEDYGVYYFILILSNALLIFLNVLYILKRTRLSASNLHISRHFKALGFFFITTAAVSLYTYFDTVILGITVGSLAVGFYTTGLKVIRLSQNFVDSIRNVLLPRISALKESQQYADIDRVVNKSLRYVLFVSIPLCIFFYIAAPEIIRIVAGDDFNASINVLRLLTLLPLLIGLSNIFGMQVLVPFRKEKKTAIAVLLGSILSVTLNLILCPIWKENGAAIACVTTELAVTFILYLYVRKEVHFEIRWTEVFKTVFCSLLFVPIVYYCRMYELHLLVTLLVSAILCLVTYVLIQFFWFQNSIIYEIVSFIRGAKLKTI